MKKEGNLNKDPYKILRSQTDMAMEEIDKLTLREAWSRVYLLRPRKPEDNRKEVCLTGFSPLEKEKIGRLVGSSSEFKWVKSVTKELAFLVCGAEAGFVKIRKAREQGAILLNKDEFLHMMKTGELPSE